MGMRTRAVPDPDRPGGWVLNGTKCWMSGVREADWYTVFAKTADPASRAHDSVTAFIVERAWEGVEVGRTDHKMGVRGVDTGELVLDDVRVPAENVIGEVGGFRLAMLGLNSMRPVVAARGIGLAEGALMYATEYVKQRAGFGQTIADFQGIQWEIAKCAVDIEAARLLTYRAAAWPTRASSPRSTCPTCRWPSTTPPSWPCGPRAWPCSCSGRPATWRTTRPSSGTATPSSSPSWRGRPRSSSA